MDHMNCYEDKQSVSPRVELASDGLEMTRNPRNDLEGQQSRVVDWIRECKEPAINTLDNARKLPGLLFIERN